MKICLKKENGASKNKVVFKEININFGVREIQGACSTVTAY